MELSSLKDSELLDRTLFWAGEERKAALALIEHLREIDRRKLYCDLGYGSLFAYCHKHLKLSEASAQRRINTMRLMSELPEVYSQLESGELSLTTASRLQSFFQKEQGLSLEKKMDILREASGKTKLELESLLLKNSKVPERHQPETVEPVSDTHFRVSFNISREELDLIERAKGLLAHSHPQGLRWSELVVAMAKQTIKTLDPSERKSRRSASPPRSEERRSPDAKTESDLWKRDQSCCTNCGSFYRVEAEHCNPWAMGGQTTLDNLRLLCHACNQRQAIRCFGIG